MISANDLIQGSCRNDSRCGGLPEQRRYVEKAMLQVARTRAECHITIIDSNDRESSKLGNYNFAVHC